MPVEIRELVIRAVVDAGPDEGGEGGDGGERSYSAVRAPAPDAAAVQAIVQECVKQVMRVLDSRKER